MAGLQRDWDNLSREWSGVASSAYSAIWCEWLEGATTVGLTSGASVPEDLVMDVLAHLAERGFGEATEYTTVEERLTFALPAELRRDMKEAAARA